MSGAEKLSGAWRFARERLGPEIQRELDGLFSARSFITMAITAAVFIAAQATPAGSVADALALIGLTLTVLFVGTHRVRGRQRHDSVLRGGECQERTGPQGRGTGTGTRIGTRWRGARRGASDPGDSRSRRRWTSRLGSHLRLEPATRSTQRDSSSRCRGRCRTGLATQAVQPSALQRLASYAVMTPPPGHRGPEPPQPREGPVGRAQREASRLGNSSQRVRRSLPSSPTNFQWRRHGQIPAEPPRPPLKRRLPGSSVRVAHLGGPMWRCSPTVRPLRSAGNMASPAQPWNPPTWHPRRSYEACPVTVGAVP